MMEQNKNHNTVTNEPLVISEDDVDVWYINPEEVGESTLSRWFTESISPDERLLCDRYVFEKDRRICLVARVLIRSVLSQYRSVPITTWQFGKNQYGKPYVNSPMANRDLSFNLAHTEGLVVCSVTLGRDVGIDVENLQRKAPLDVASHYFGLGECAYLATLCSEDRSEAFFTFWTLKEAYIKARGLGLAIPLSHFEFRFTDRGDAVIEFSPEMGDDPRGWQFFLPEEFAPSHRVAVAVAAAKSGSNLNRLRVRAAEFLIHGDNE